jgi:hypothetical protein
MLRRCLIHSTVDLGDSLGLVGGQTSVFSATATAGQPTYWSDRLSKRFDTPTERIKLLSKAYFPARGGFVRKVASKTDKGFGPWAFTKD